MLFEKRLRDGIRNGSITLAFRRWKRSQVVAGHRYRMGAGAGLARVHAVAAVNPSSISDADARAAGFPSLPALLADLADSEDPTYRIVFSAVTEPDPRVVLGQSVAISPAELTELEHKLDRLDHARRWTRQTLQAIADQPGVRAGDLAPKLGWSELQDFKLHVRKLKELGLTISLPVGYQLSPRGAAFVRAISSRRRYSGRSRTAPRRRARPSVRGPDRV